MKKRVGLFVYPGITMLDVLAPHQLLGYCSAFELMIVAATTEPVTGDTGMRVVPDYDFRSCPDVDIIVAGGSVDTSEPMSDPATMEWFRKAGARAEWVTAVCSGTLLLAEAGLLDGYKVATHWANVADLKHYPELTWAEGRVVRDRNRMTAGGVTAGVDFALHLITEVAGEEAAAAVQLMVEYDPLPPTRYGHPRSAPPELVAAIAEMARPLRTGLDAFFAAKNAA